MTWSSVSGERMAFISRSEYRTPGVSRSTIFRRSATRAFALVGKRASVPSSLKYLRTSCSDSSSVSAKRSSTMRAFAPKSTSRAPVFCSFSRIRFRARKTLACLTFSFILKRWLRTVERLIPKSLAITASSCPREKASISRAWVSDTPSQSRRRFSRKMNLGPCSRSACRRAALCASKRRPSTGKTSPRENALPQTRQICSPFSGFSTTPAASSSIVALSKASIAIFINTTSICLFINKHIGLFVHCVKEV